MVGFGRLGSSLALATGARVLTVRGSFHAIVDRGYSCLM